MLKWVIWVVWERREKLRLNIESRGAKIKENLSGKIRIKNIESRKGAETQRKEKNLKRERLKNWIPQRRRRRREKQIKDRFYLMGNTNITKVAKGFSQLWCSQQSLLYKRAWPQRTAFVHCCVKTYATFI